MSSRRPILQTSVAAVVRVSPGGENEACGGDQEAPGVKACEYINSDQVLLTYLKQQHERYLHEVEQLSAPLGKAQDFSDPSGVG